MRIITILIFVLLISNSILGQKTANSYYVYAVNGLNMRVSPLKNSEVKSIIPYGARIKITDNNTENKEFEINGLKGRYILIEYSDTTGYIFSGYISRILPPSLTKGWVELNDYLVEQYGKCEKKTSSKEPNPTDSTDMRYGIQYSDDIDYYNFGEECNTIERMFIKNISVNEAFLFLTTFNAQYRNVKLDMPVKYDKDFNSYHSQLPLQFYQYSRILTYKKDKANNIISLEICFDTESGSGCASIFKSKNKDNVIIIEFLYSCS